MKLPRLATATLAVSGLVAGGVVAGTAGAAHADDPYAYWLYYSVVDGSYDYLEDAGPGKNVPADGSIEAYRYASSLFPPTQTPRIDLDKVGFEQICGEEKAGEGEKRVAVIVDYGIDGDSPTSTDAPEPTAACAVVPEDATGLQTLQSVFEVRTGDDSALCGIQGYPASGCFDVGTKVSEQGEPVELELAGDEAMEAADEDSSKTPLLIGAGIVAVLLVAGGVVLSRRRA